MNTWILYVDCCIFRPFSLVCMALCMCCGESSDLFWWFCGGFCGVCDLTSHFFLCYVFLFICSKQMLWRHHISTRFFSVFIFCFFHILVVQRYVWYIPARCLYVTVLLYVLWTRLQSVNNWRYLASNYRV